MELSKVKDQLKTMLDYEDASFTVNKSDSTKQKTMCLFQRSPMASNAAIGGKSATGYTAVALSLFVRWGENYALAESKSAQLFRALDSAAFSIGGVSCWIVMMHTAPIPLGTDAKGIYEYAIDFNFYNERID
jgi:hypothetical protein